MPVTTIPYTFSAGTKIVSAQVNSNFSTIANVLNGVNQLPRNLLIAGNPYRLVANDASGNPTDVGALTTGVVLTADANGLPTGVAPGTTGNVLLSNGTVWTSAALSTNIPSSSAGLFNIGFSGAVASNALTVTLTQADGATAPAAGTASILGFRSATATTGGYNVRSVTSSISIVVPSGATLGTANSVSQKLALYALDNAGTVELAIAGYRAFDDNSLQTTTAITSGSSSGAVLYSTTLRTAVPVRYLGDIVISEATAGAWASAPTALNFSPPKYSESQIASAGPLNFPPATPAWTNITSVTLTPGEWLITSSVQFTPYSGQFLTQVTTGIASATASDPVSSPITGLQSQNIYGLYLTLSTGGPLWLTSPLNTYRVKVSATAVVYLNGLVAQSGSPSPTQYILASGGIYAERIR